MGWVKNILIFASGAACGCTGMYFFMRNQHKEIEKCAEDARQRVIELDEMNGELIEENKKLNSKIESFSEYCEEKERIDKVIEEQKTAYENIAKNYNPYASASDQCLEEDTGRDISVDPDEPEDDDSFDADNFFEKDIADDIPEPHIIPYTEFGVQEDYDTISLTRYADGVITDDNDEKMTEEEVDAAIGLNNLSSIIDNGEYVAYICNNERRVYYEIVIDYRAYEQ